MVMKYYANGDILQCASNKVVTGAKLLELLHQAGVILCALHAHGFIHRDIKPQNILVDENLKVVIADLMTVTSFFRTIYSIKGTFEYVLPEILLLRNSDSKVVLDERLLKANDVYAFAKTVLTILKEDSHFPMVQLCASKIVANPYSYSMNELVDCIAYELQTGSAKSANQKHKTAPSVLAEKVNCGTALHIDNEFLVSNGPKQFSEVLLGFSNLQSIHICNTTLDFTGMKRMFNELYKCVALHQLVLSNNGLCAKGALSLADALKPCQHLQKLTILNNNIGAAGATHIANAIVHYKNLTSLALCGNKIGNEGASSLALSFHSCKYITELDLSCNNIGANGAMALACTFTQVQSSLQVLNLSGNCIGDECSQFFCLMFDKCHSLKKLLLSSNQLTCNAACSIFGALHFSKLCHLDLSNNLLCDSAAHAAAKALTHCACLTSLNLSNNQIGNAGVKAIANSLPQCKQQRALLCLDLSANLFDAQVAAELQQLNACIVTHKQHE